MNKTAIIIISYNNKDITSNLCNQIVKYTKSDYDLLVVETGSKKEELTNYPTLWVPDSIRMTNGIKFGLSYSFWKDLNKELFSIDYNSYWILVNDTIHPDYDVLTPMINFMNNTSDCGEIHPYINNSPSKYLHKKENNGPARKESFCEIVCPLFSKNIFEIENIDLFDSRFFYGWGIDYDISYKIHLNGYRIYISNEVGIIHNAGTTVRSGKDKDFKNMTEQFNTSRENMYVGLTKKYGPNWARLFYGSIPQDVSKDTFYDWIINIGQNCKKEDII